MISLKNITKSYQDNMILKNASFSITHGELIGIIGRSGSGKTTLLNIIGLLEQPDQGEYYFNNELVNSISDTRKTVLRRDKIGFIFQNYELIKERSVYYNIVLPLLCKNKSKKEMKSQVIDIARRLNIEHLIDKSPREISGGEAQRVAIARALIREPEIILADEPTGALDQKSELEILKIFQSLNRTGTTVLIVTHNPNVADICSKLYTIENGKIVVCDGSSWERKTGKLRNRAEP